MIRENIIDLPNTWIKISLNILALYFIKKLKPVQWIFGTFKLSKSKLKYS